MAISRRTLLQHLGAGALGAAAAPRIAFADGGASGFAAAPNRFIRLHRNESPHGPSPKVLAAMREATSQSARYPDAATASLRQTIAEAHGVPLERVVPGCGSTEVLQMAIHAFAGRGKTIVAARPTFETLAHLARRTGSRIVDVPLNKDYSHDLQAMRDRVDGRTGLIYICNPHSPTGTLTRRQHIDAMLEKLPPHVLVVIDEAYHDFVGHAADYRSLIDRTDHPSVIVTRSFSKIHGLAGLRIGYGLAAAPTVARLSAHASSGDINIVAARAAEAALADLEQVRERVNRIADDRQEFLNHANARMLRSIDSLTNFIMLNAGRPSAQVVDHFAKHRVLVAGSIPGFDNYIRVSIGAPAEMQEFWRVWDLMPGGHMHGH
jgi:histidinol-phosphate aminotransferase